MPKSKMRIIAKRIRMGITENHSNIPFTRLKSLKDNDEIDQFEYELLLFYLLNIYVGHLGILYGDEYIEKMRLEGISPLSSLGGNGNYRI